MTTCPQNRRMQLRCVEPVPGASGITKAVPAICLIRFGFDRRPQLLLIWAVLLGSLVADPWIGSAQNVPPGPNTVGTEPCSERCAAVDSLASQFLAAKNSQSSADNSQDAADRPLGSAFFGGEGDPPIFGVSPPQPGKESPEWPNISEPGPDMGDFPNSAFTLPKGRAYIEVAPVTLLNASTQNPPAYLAPFLLRYGLTDNVEFRVFGHGLTSAGGSNPTTGLSPLNFDLKVHLWNDRKEWLIPAVSLEVYILTQTGSPQFNSGLEPSINLNFDLPITKKFNLEWTVGRSGVQETVNASTVFPGENRQFNLDFQQFSASWAIEYEVNDRLEVFVHGFHNGAILLNLGAGDAVGAGLFWKFSPRLTGFGSLDSGLTSNLPSLGGQLGFALAL